jgi:hypothetical protein
MRARKLSAIVFACLLSFSSNAQAAPITDVTNIGNAIANAVVGVITGGTSNSCTSGSDCPAGQACFNATTCLFNQYGPPTMPNSTCQVMPQKPPTYYGSPGGAAWCAQGTPCAQGQVCYYPNVPSGSTYPTWGVCGDPGNPPSPNCSTTPVVATNWNPFYWRCGNTNFPFLITQAQSKRDSEIGWCYQLYRPNPATLVNAAWYWLTFQDASMWQNKRSMCIAGWNAWYDSALSQINFQAGCCAELNSQAFPPKLSPACMGTDSWSKPIYNVG